MDSLLARYFDGELNDRDAQMFLEKVESDPALEKELRAYETLLAMGPKLTDPQAPPGFTRRVMRSIHAPERKGRTWRMPVFARLNWSGLATAAAVIALTFIGGLWTGRSRMVPPQISETPPSFRGAIDDVTPGMVSRSVASNSDLRYVRLAYQPTNPSVRQVSIAGSFNNWDPVSMPLQKQNGVWATVLVLPPGTYEYMFVENEEHWITDPLAVNKRDDGFGGVNAVLDVER
jgi:hypothetical protein